MDFGKEVNRLIKEDICKQGLEFSGGLLIPNAEERERARARGGRTLGHIVHTAFENDNAYLDFDDVTGAHDKGPDSRHYCDLSSKLIPDNGATQGLTLDLPIISANMMSVTSVLLAIELERAGGLSIFSQFFPRERYWKFAEELKAAKVNPLQINDAPMKPTLDKNGKYAFGMAVGVKNFDLNFVTEMYDSGLLQVLCIDAAQCYMDSFLRRVNEVKSARPALPLIVGNLVSPKGVYEVLNAGADIAKVGQGSSPACDTSLVAGFWGPPISSGYYAAVVAKALGKGIILDGGMGTTGAMSKGLATGAAAVMLGKYFASTNSSNDFNKRIVCYEGNFLTQSWDIFSGKGRTPKQLLYYGSASKRGKQAQGRDYWDTPEGRDIILNYTGQSIVAIAQAIVGLKSSFSYGGKFDGNPTLSTHQEKTAWRLSPHSAYSRQRS